MSAALAAGLGLSNMIFELAKHYSTWAEGASQLIGDCFDQAKPFIDKNYDGLDDYVRFVNSQLFIDCHLTSESVLVLIKAGKEWDADLVNRAVMEGTLKYLYMVMGEQNEVKQKAEEYWNILPAFASVKRSERAKRFLEEVPDPENLKWQPFRDLLLTEQEKTTIRQVMNKKQRSELEEKWSFSGIIKQLLMTDNDELRFFAHLAHGYGMSSHLLHKDGDGVGMVWERYTREKERQVVVRLGHAARIVSDVCVFAKLRLLYLLKICSQETKCIVAIEKRYLWLTEELEKANSDFSKVEYV